MSPVTTSKFVRNPMVVDAIQVTRSNFFEVAEWCQGTVRNSEDVPIDWVGNQDVPDPSELHIFVRVHNPKTEKQTQARIGDWILYMTRGGYKVYNDRAFRNQFKAHQPRPEVHPNQGQFPDGGSDGSSLPVAAEVSTPVVSDSVDDVPSPGAEPASADSGSTTPEEPNPIELTEEQHRANIERIKSEARTQTNLDVLKP